MNSNVPTSMRTRVYRYSDADALRMTREGFFLVFAARSRNRAQAPLSPDILSTPHASGSRHVMRFLLEMPLSASRAPCSADRLDVVASLNNICSFHQEAFIIRRLCFLAMYGIRQQHVLRQAMRGTGCVPPGKHSVITPSPSPVVNVGFRDTHACMSPIQKARIGIFCVLLFIIEKS